jgi:hypothetical protein
VYFVQSGLDCLTGHYRDKESCRSMARFRAPLPANIYIKYLVNILISKLFLDDLTEQSRNLPLSYRVDIDIFELEKHFIYLKHTIFLSLFTSYILEKNHLKLITEM